MRTLLIVVLALFSLLCVSCVKETFNPVAPPPLAPPQSMSGDWVISGAVNIEITLTDSAGQISGTFITLSGAPSTPPRRGPIVISGTYTDANTVTLSGRNSTSYLLIEGNVTVNRADFVGTILLMDGDHVYSCGPIVAHKAGIPF